MTREAINSRRNPHAQLARAARDGRERGLVFVEGVRLCEEALGASAGMELALHTRDLAEDKRGAELLKRIKNVCPAVHLVSDDVLASVSDTKTPQGVVALARRPRTGPEVLENISGAPL